MKSINRSLSIAKSFTCITMIIILFVSQYPAISYGISEQQKSLFNSDILYYDIDQCLDINATNTSESGEGGAADGAKFPNLPENALVEGIDTYISGTNPDSKLKDLGKHIVASAKNANISPFLIVAIAQMESSMSSPTDYNVRNGNNSFGRTATSSQPHFMGSGPAANTMWYKWSSAQASVDYTAPENKNANGGGDIASYIREKYSKKIDNDNLTSVMMEYAPPHENDTDEYVKRIKQWTSKMIRIVESKKGSSSTGGEGGPTLNLEGHELPATEGGTGLEDPVTAAGNLVGSSEKVTFSNHANLGQEYRDYYITMRWNYVKWNWNGTTAGVDNDEFNWFKEKPRLVLVTNPETNKSVVTAAIEAGPAPWTGVDSGPNNDAKQGWVNPQKGTPSSYKGRVSGLPPEAFRALGMTSSDQKMSGDNGPDLLYSWAPDQSVKPGPTSVSVNDLSITSSSSECQCSVQNPDGSKKTAGGDVDKFIKALAQQESGGDPNQPGSAGGARGKYQYIDSTWRSSAQTYYRPALEYSTANAAPESVQDAVAFLEYSKKFKDLNNDLFKLAVSHFYPIANTNSELLDVVPPQNVITPRQYASKLINSIRRGGAWENIPLKYSEAPDFNTYARAIDVSETSESDPSGNTLSSTFCSTETGGDNNEGTGEIKWPLDKKYWNQNKEWFTKPHHDYPAADIPVSSGTKVYSMTSGKVQVAGNNGGCGVSVFITYKDNINIGYCHGTPGSLKVKSGDNVRAGQLIMLSDNTGQSTGPHLHVQVKIGGSLKCPQDIFTALGDNREVDFNSLRSSGCSY